jgi:hypothetical protein
MRFIFGLSLLVDRVERVLPGVVGVDGGDVAELLPATAVVIGDTVDATVGASITLGGGAFLFPLAAFSRARRTAICFPGLLLSLSENLHARIASGTVDLGQRNR